MIADVSQHRKSRFVTQSTYWAGCLRFFHSTQVRLWTQIGIVERAVWSSAASTTHEYGKETAEGVRSNHVVSTPTGIMSMSILKTAGFYQDYIQCPLALRGGLRISYDIAHEEHDTHGRKFRKRRQPLDGCIVRFRESRTTRQDRRRHSQRQQSS